MIKGLLSVGEKVAIWSGELNNQMLKTWLYSAIAGEKAVNKIAHPFRPGEYISTIKPDYEERINKAVAGKLFVYDGNKNNGFDMIKNFTMLHKRYGVKYFFIDNLSILDMSVKGVGKYEGEEEFAKVVASFTRNNPVHLFKIMHPIKQNLNTDPNFVDRNGRVKRPEFYDQYSVKGSSAIVNLAHNIMFLGRATDHFKAYMCQEYKTKMEEKGAPQYEIDRVLSLINKEFSLIAYLVKNRQFGYIYESALFGYNHETRRIYGLLSKDEDLSKEVINDMITKEDEQIEEFDYDQF